MKIKSRVVSSWVMLAAVAWSVTPGFITSAAENKEQELIKVLQSDAPPEEKAITCKRLAVYGGKDAVPVLAPLLARHDLASWARIALEVIPDPSADEALRAAVTQLQGRLLVGTINSVGTRRDAQAVQVLAEKLEHADVEVAAAAAEALGHIGGENAGKALEKALSSNQVEVRSAAAYGATMCAERLLAEGKAAAAVALCDKVRQADVPKQRKLEAIRGAILARKSEGVPLLVEHLKSQDAALFGIGVRTARELPGPEVTKAVSAELDQAGPDRQISLLLALADRSDPAVMPKVLQVAETGSKPLRVTAVGLLDRFQDLACVPILLNAATESDPELARTAKSTLARLGGKEVDTDLLARLRLASGKARQVLLEMAGLRRLEGAVPLLMRSAEDPDADVRRAALDTISVLGTEQQAGGLVRLLSSTGNADTRDEIERALSAICRRSGVRALPQVLPLAQTGNTALRKVGLRALASIGGAEGLAAVKTAAQDRDESIQDEAVNLLSTWPNTWPEDAGVAEPLLNLVKSGKKPSYQSQALRGYLQFIEETKTLNTDDKLAKLSDLLGFLKGADEKRQIISVVGTVPSPKSLELLLTAAQDQAVAEESYMAALKVATDRKLRDSSKELRRKALETVAEKAQDEATKKKAGEELKKIR